MKMVNRLVKYESIIIINIKPSMCVVLPDGAASFSSKKIHNLTQICNTDKKKIKTIMNPVTWLDGWCRHRSRVP